MVLGGCAQDAASQKELSELRAELRAVRIANERMEDRLLRLENERAMRRAKDSAKSKGTSGSASADTRTGTSEQAWTGSAVPELAVVRVKPRKQAAPPLHTETDVQEPSSDELDALLTQAAGAYDAQTDDAEGDGSVDLSAEGQAAAAAAADHTFEQALASLKTGNVSGAVLALQAFSAEHPRHPQSDNALFFSGVGLMALDDFEGAARAFDRVLKEYPAGDARLDAMLHLGDCRVRLNQKEDARSLYAKLISAYPGTAAANKAQKRLSQITQ